VRASKLLADTSGEGRPCWYAQRGVWWTCHGD